MLEFSTPDPTRLLRAFKAAVGTGHIRTWEDDGDGWFRHKAAEWRTKGVVEPSTSSGSLQVRTLVFKSVPIQDRLAVYSYLNCHLAETFINHFDNMLFQAVVHAAPDPSDSLN